jgi:hypothetical protein
MNRIVFWMPSVTSANRTGRPSASNSAPPPTKARYGVPVPGPVS